jgi:Domain of unknown function (DUF222)
MEEVNPMPDVEEPDPKEPGAEGRPESEEPQPGSECGGPRFTWMPGSEPGGGVAAGLDWQAMLEALAASGVLDGDPDNQDAELAEELQAEADGRMGSPLDPVQLAAFAVEYMEPGPALAGWLEVAAGAAGSLDENGLTGLAVAARRQAARANGVELAAVAQIASRAAAADRRTGVSGAGRPARVCRDAVGQVEMALWLSPDGAAAWADLAFVLTWRLPSTLAALAAGWIDLKRAEIIARATSVLSEQAARDVEARVLPRARRKTYPQLRDWLGHLVVAADPQGAEERRQRAERNANVRLFAEEDQTATLVGDKLPQIESAAGFARITALARERKAAGLPGSLGLHRAQVLLGLILGTPPPDGSGEPPPPSDGSDGPPPPSAEPPPPPGEPPLPSDDLPPPPEEPLPGDVLDPADGADGAGDGPDGAGDGPDGAGDGPDGARDRLGDSGEHAGQGDACDPWDDDDPYGSGPAPVWPALGSLPAALTRPAPPDGTPPAAGLLDVTLPWTTLAGITELPGTLGRIGAITPAQARQLTLAAASDSAAQWRVIVTDPDGHALTVARIRRRARHRPERPGSRLRDGPHAGRGPAGRVTLTISQDTITALASGGGGPPGNTGSAGSTGPPGDGASVDWTLAAALRTAERALQRALAQAAADAAAGGCAHNAAAEAYRPPPRLREHVIARDRTCRNPVCGQPAWRADLDHTIPWENGGPTCNCNLGGECRRDHQLKQDPRWKLTQTKPGWFEWTAPSGRTYTTEPATYLA